MVAVIPPSIRRDFFSIRGS